MTYGISTTRQETIMKEMKNMMLKQNEAVIQQEVARADSEDVRIANAMQQLSRYENTGRGEELEDSRQKLLLEMGQQQASNDNFRKMCEEVLSRIVQERTGQKIKGVKAINHSSAVAGFINVSDEEMRIDQDISDVTAENRSFAGAGVIRDLNFRDLRSTAADEGRTM